MRITILRHGVPDLSGWGKIHSSSMPEWIKAYNSAGVKNSPHSSCQAMIADGKHNFIVCSNLPRSIHSAQIIGYQTPHLVDAIFREAELPDIQIPIIRLAPHSWSVVFRVFWFAGVSKKVESLELFKQRISLAAEKLVQLAKQHDSILLVGHGIINRFLAKELIAKGWVGEQGTNGNIYRSYKYWEVATYTKS